MEICTRVYRPRRPRESPLFRLVEQHIEEFLTNLRLNFIHRPGSDLFIVLNEDRGEGASLSRVANRGFAVKLTYLIR